MVNKDNIPSIILLQPVLAHYRQSFFNALLKMDNARFTILAGNGRVPVKEYSPSPEQQVILMENTSISLGSHRFYRQIGLFRNILKIKPDVIIAPGIDLHWPQTLLLAIYVRLFTNCKLIWWGHGTSGKEGSSGRFIRKAFFRLGHGIITYNRAGQAALSRILPDIPVIPVFNSLNLVDYGFSDSGHSQLSSGKITLLFSGRLMKEKRTDVLVDAIAILLNQGISLKCNIIGDGPEFEPLKQKIAGYGISENVRLRGAVYGNEAREFFRNSDIFVLPGKVGLSVVHALSFGLPVLTTGQISVHSPEYELINPGTNGDFFKGFDPDSLAAAILVWSERLKKNPEEIRNACRLSVQTGEYLPEKMANKMANFAVKLAGNETGN